MQDLIVYVHVPFCSSKCHFCYWTSPISAADLVNKKSHSAEYKDAVVQQIKRFGAGLKTRPRMKLIYFGGGTPSLMEAPDLAAICDTIHSVFRKDTDSVDTTIEIAPETVDCKKLCDLKSAGFSRISFGFQSLNERRTKQIGRAHSVAQAIQAFHMAREAGFNNVNIDLMLGFPDETEDEWWNTLSQAMALSPDHMSLYVYKKVPGTVMANQLEKGTSKETPPNVAVERYLAAADKLSNAGYREYMFQLFEREGKHCFCDESYFNHDFDHVGFGAGGHSLIGGYLMGHSPDLKSFLRNPQFDYRFPIANSAGAIQHKLFEMLHTDQGIDPEKFERRMRISIDGVINRYPQIAAFFNDLSMAGVNRDGAGRYRFMERSQRVAWLAPPPKRYDAPPVRTNLEKEAIVQVANV